MANTTNLSIRIDRDLKDEDDRIFYDTAKEAGAHLITRNLRHYPKEPHILEPSAYLDYIRKQ